MWELAGNYTGCMTGYHAVSLMADGAYARVIQGGIKYGPVVVIVGCYIYF